MKFGLFVEFGAMNSKPVFDAFATGCKRLGHEVVYNSTDCDIAVIWSVLWHGRMSRAKTVWDEFKRVNKPVIVLEVGALDRNNLWKVGINGINRDATFGPGGNDSVRANLLGIKFEPWQYKDSGHILICTQHDKSEQWKGKPSQSTWVLQVIEHIRSHTDRSIVIRPHPRCPLTGIDHEFPNCRLISPMHVPGTYDDFDFNVDNVYAVVNYSSNPGIHAVLNGVPAYVGEHSLARPVASDIFGDYNLPQRPDRQQWLNDLVHNEWSVKEISEGIPLKRLTSYL